MRPSPQGCPHARKHLKEGVSRASSGTKSQHTRLGGAFEGGAPSAHIRQPQNLISAAWVCCCPGMCPSPQGCPHARVWWEPLKEGNPVSAHGGSALAPSPSAARTCELVALRVGEGGEHPAPIVGDLHGGASMQHGGVVGSAADPTDPSQGAEDSCFAHLRAYPPVNTHEPQMLTTPLTHHHQHRS
jgi:hypothetical protein